MEIEVTEDEFVDGNDSDHSCDVGDEPKSIEK